MPAVPDLAAVASALAASGFACNALCAVRKEAGGAGDGLRLLALGHSTEEVLPGHNFVPPHAYTLVKVSPGGERPAFQPLRALNTCVICRPNLLQLCLRHDTTRVPLLQPPGDYCLPCDASLEGLGLA